MEGFGWIVRTGRSMAADLTEELGPLYPVASRGLLQVESPQECVAGLDVLRWHEVTLRLARGRDEVLR